MEPPLSFTVGLLRSAGFVLAPPGGSYGTTFPVDVRRKDLIMANPPDLEMYLQHIWHFSSVEVEVFEWDLKPEDALEL